MENNLRKLSKTAAEAFIAARPWSFTMSLISVFAGSLLAAEGGRFYPGWFALACLGIILFHGSANVLNDYFDTRNGVDQPDSPTALYRRQPILSESFTPRQTLLLGVVLCGLAVLIGLILSFERSLLVLWIGLAGIFAAIFYTAGPLKLKYRAWGEVLAFFVWGPLMFEGAYAVQRQALSPKVLLISIPFGMLVVLVVLANNIRDIAYDTRQRIKTVSIYLGPSGSMRLYAGIVLAAYLCVIAMVLTRTLGLWSLLVLLSFPKALTLIRRFSTEIPDAADAQAAQLNTVFGILLIFALLLEEMAPL